MARSRRRRGLRGEYLLKGTARTTCHILGKYRPVYNRVIISHPVIIGNICGVRVTSKILELEYGPGAGCGALPRRYPEESTIYIGGTRKARDSEFPGNPVCGSRAQRLPGRAHVPMIWRAGHTRLGARQLSVGGGRCPEMYGVTRVRTMPSDQEESARDSSLWQ